MEKLKNIEIDISEIAEELCRSHPIYSSLIYIFKSLPFDTRQAIIQNQVSMKFEKFTIDQRREMKEFTSLIGLYSSLIQFLSNPQNSQEKVRWENIVRLMWSRSEDITEMLYKPECIDKFSRVYNLTSGQIKEFLIILINATSVTKTRLINETQHLILELSNFMGEKENEEMAALSLILAGVMNEGLGILERLGFVWSEQLKDKAEYEAELVFKYHSKVQLQLSSNYNSALTLMSKPKLNDLIDFLIFLSKSTFISNIESDGKFHAFASKALTRANFLSIAVGIARAQSVLDMFRNSLHLHYSIETDLLTIVDEIERLKFELCEAKDWECQSLLRIKNKLEAFEVDVSALNKAIEIQSNRNGMENAVDRFAYGISIGAAYSVLHLLSPNLIGVFSRSLPLITMSLSYPIKSVFGWFYPSPKLNPIVTSEFEMIKGEESEIQVMNGGVGVKGVVINY